MKSLIFAPSVALAVLLVGQACGETVGAPCSVQEECSGQTLCVSFDVGDERSCHRTCSTEADCAEGELCSAPDYSSESVCHPPFPNCDPEATDADCACGTLSGALRVQGEGGACTVEERDVTVCAWNRYECLDGGCSEGYARYTYPDDAGYIVHVAGPGRMPEGWESNGVAIDGDEPGAPTSCPAAAPEP